ncbi:hypothetical protein ZIOFF_062775 [Zingiber officinale]|uniref:phosphoenolpyruvate carboxykinase (ATP) n=1 Tax=Zingiber officinale TaxID=94328 RepID=A0A8J5F5U1_ZINOF|nr:hypothetical protein ZIOFF_062775 [Zingiber officinale]
MKIQTHGREKPENGICHDDSAPLVKAKTIDELHSLQKKRLAPTTPIKEGAQQGNAAFATISEEERQKLQLQSIRFLVDFSKPKRKQFLRTRILEAPEPRLKNPLDAEEPKKNKKIIVEDEFDVKYKSFKKFDTVKEHSDHYFSIPEHLDGVPSCREIKYAGEMKKGLFGVMHYLMPKRNILSLHSSNNMGKYGDVALFFGLSGTGKTTLSTYHNRLLIGDDEHCWSENGIPNIEGGCYAKCINLTKEKEPDIWNAMKFGTGKCPIKLDMHFELEPFIFFCPNVCKFLAVLENIVFDEHTREVDYSDNSITENTRASYPIEYIPNAKIPCVGLHPKNVILLACDAFGVLPPASKLTLPQTMYHFISGYTALVHSPLHQAHRYACP